MTMVVPVCTNLWAPRHSWHSLPPDMAATGKVTCFVSPFHLCLLSWAAWTFRLVALFTHHLADSITGQVCHLFHYFVGLPNYQESLLREVMRSEEMCSVWVMVLSERKDQHVLVQSHKSSLNWLRTSCPWAACGTLFALLSLPCVLRTLPLSAA